MTEEDFEIIQLIKNKKSIILVNKIDLDEKWDILKIFGDKKVFNISAKSKIGIEEIENEIERLWKNNDIDTGEDIIISNMRHKNLILEASDSAKNALEALKCDLPVDMVSIDIKSLLDSLGEITGQNVSEETINGIFSRFCLGK